MRVKSLFIIITGFTACLLAGCVSTPMPIRHLPVDYSASQPLEFDVAELLVINDSSLTADTKTLTAYGPSPEDALIEWSKHRIVRAGTQGSLSVIIRDANFSIHPLPVQRGLKAKFERQQAERWDAFLHVIIAIEGSASQLPPAEITLSVRHSQTLPENASDEEKRQTYQSILNRLMTLFDAEAQKQMHEYFRAYYL